MNKLRFPKIQLAMATLATAVCCCAALPAQETSSIHVVITNNNVYQEPMNSAAVFQLAGSSLTSAPLLRTNGEGVGVQFYATNQQVVAAVGGKVCTFISDGNTSDIAAFDTTNFGAPVHLGKFVDPSGMGNYSGIALATRGTVLIAGYSMSSNIGVWAINSDCSLTLASPASNTPVARIINDVNISPDQKTVVATFDVEEPGLYTFALSGTSLTQAGVYDSAAVIGGIDFSADSQYVLLGGVSATGTQVDIFPINSDSTLGEQDYYSFAEGGNDASNLWLSPDGTALYVSNNDSLQITTLRFNEAGNHGRRLAFNCLSSVLKNPAGGTISHTGGIATASPTGKGEYLYVAEYGSVSAIGLLSIPAGACPVEVSGSPFVNPTQGFPGTLVAYPSRPF